jgi:hypothetical protein
VKLAGTETMTESALFPLNCSAFRRNDLKIKQQRYSALKLLPAALNIFEVPSHRFML